MSLLAISGATLVDVAPHLDRRRQRRARAGRARRDRRRRLRRRVGRNCGRRRRRAARGRRGRARRPAFRDAASRRGLAAFQLAAAGQYLFHLGVIGRAAQGLGVGINLSEIVSRIPFDAMALLIYIAIRTKARTAGALAAAIWSGRSVAANFWGKISAVPSGLKCWRIITVTSIGRTIRSITDPSPVFFFASSLVVSFAHNNALLGGTRGGFEGARLVRLAPPGKHRRRRRRGHGRLVFHARNRRAF